MLQYVVIGHHMTHYTLISLQQYIVIRRCLYTFMTRQTTSKTNQLYYIYIIVINIMTIGLPNGSISTVM